MNLVDQNLPLSFLNVSICKLPAEKVIETALIFHSIAASTG